MPKVLEVQLDYTQVGHTRVVIATNDITGCAEVVIVVLLLTVTAVVHRLVKLETLSIQKY